MKAWGAMQEEVRAVNTKVGWWDQEVPWKTAMALLHSEASEILEAWRKWGLKDATGLSTTTWPLNQQKPEGVPSEMADVLIRMLDDAERYDIRVHDIYWTGFLNGIPDEPTLPEDVDDLHSLITSLSNWEGAGLDREMAFVLVLTFLREMATKYGVDLPAEYEKKLAYNETRPYRHNKAV